MYYSSQWNYILICQFPIVAPCSSRPVEGRIYWCLEKLTCWRSCLLVRCFCFGHGFSSSFFGSMLLCCNLSASLAAALSAAASVLQRQQQLFWVQPSVLQSVLLHKSVGKPDKKTPHRRPKIGEDYYLRISSRTCSSIALSRSSFCRILGLRGCGNLCDYRLGPVYCVFVDFVELENADAIKLVDLGLEHVPQLERPSSLGQSKPENEDQLGLVVQWDKCKNDLQEILHEVIQWKDNPVRQPLNVVILAFSAESLVRLNWRVQNTHKHSNHTNSRNHGRNCSSV